MNSKTTSLFFSDIVGYSSLFSNNEKLALNLLSEHDIIVEKRITENDGTIIKRIGDAVFAEFGTPERAYHTSIQIQKELAKRNEILSKENKIEVRIGLHYGTVYENDGDLFGNDVNICSRLESIAFPSAIACSDQLVLELDGIDIFKREYGYAALKNIKKPVKVYKIYTDHDHYVSENDSAIEEFIKNRGIQIHESDEIKKEYLTIGFLYPKNLSKKEAVEGSEVSSFFSFEVHKQMIDYANKISIIRTPSFESVIKYKDKELQEIAFELALEYLMQSTLLVDEDSFKIIFTLFSIHSGKNIYEKSFEGKFHEMKNVIGSLLIDLSDMLNFQIEDELINVFKKDINVNNKAYKLFLEGKHLSDYTTSADSLEKSKIKLKESIQIDDQFAEAYAALGITYGLMGNYDEAEEYFDEAEEIVEDSDNLESLSLVFNYLGIYHRDQGKLKKSIRFFEKSLKALKKLNDRAQLANIYNNMTMTYSISGKNDKALNLCSKAELIYKELDERIRLGNVYGQMGNISFNMNNLEEAVNYYNLAKQIFLSEEMHARLAQVLILQAECYFSIDNIDDAKNNLSQTEDIAHNFSMPILNARHSWLMAKICLNEAEYSDALDHIDESIDIFDELNNKVKLADTQLLKIRILLEKGKKDKAKKVYKKTKRLIERMDSGRMDKEQMESGLAELAVEFE